MHKPVDLTIVVLSYNSQFWLKKTLSSLQEKYLVTTTRKVEVIVVDNNSQDESVKMMRHDFPEIKLILNSANTGFAAGNNLALKEVTSTYTMLLNSDVELTDDSNLDTLLEYLDTHPKVGVITPLIKLVNGEIDLACHRGEPTLWASFTYFFGLERLFPYSQRFSQYHQLYKGFGETHEIDACSGAAMLLRTSAMHKVGLLDEQFFMYAEDLDWCKRFRDQHYKIVFFPQVSVIHHKYKSGISSLSTQTATKTKNYFYQTMLQYYDKHYHNRYPRWVRRVIYYFLEMKKGAL